MSNRTTTVIEIFHDEDGTMVALGSYCCEWMHDMVSHTHHRARGKLIESDEFHPYAIDHRGIVNYPFLGPNNTSNGLCLDVKFDDSYPPTMRGTAIIPFHFCPDCGARIMVKKLPVEEVYRMRKIKQLEEDMLK